MVTPIVSGRWWTLRVALVTTVISVFFQAPPLHVKRLMFSEVVAQGESLLTPLGADPASHAGKLAFRLVPPLLARYLNLTPEAYYALQYVLGVTTLAALAWLFHHMGYTRRAAFALVVALAFTYVGAVWFLDTTPYFDALAATALVLAMCARHPALVFVAASAALWTDERALLAAVVVAAWHFKWRGRAGAAAVAVALVFYGALRTFLSARYGLTTGRTGIGPSIFFELWKTMPVALLLSLEGLWILLVGGLIPALRARDRGAWVVLVCAAASAAVAVMVYDVSRSTVYLLPAVVVAAAYLLQASARVRERVLAASVVVCVLVPTTSVIIDDFGPWYPLLVRAVF